MSSFSIKMLVMESNVDMNIFFSKKGQPSWTERPESVCSYSSNMVKVGLHWFFGVRMKNLRV